MMTAIQLQKLFHLLVAFALIFPMNSAAAPDKATCMPAQIPHESRPQAVQSYSISGKVTDSQGSGIGRVTVTARPESTPILLVHGFRGLGVASGCIKTHKTMRTEGEA
jgi:hypothetical protein